MHTRTRCMLADDSEPVSLLSCLCICASGFCLGASHSQPATVFERLSKHRIHHREANMSSASTSLHRESQLNSSSSAQLPAASHSLQTSSMSAANAFNSSQRHSGNLAPSQPRKPGKGNTARLSSFTCTGKHPSLCGATALTLLHSCLHESHCSSKACSLQLLDPHAAIKLSIVFYGAVNV